MISKKRDNFLRGSTPVSAKAIYALNMLLKISGAQMDYPVSQRLVLSIVPPPYQRGVMPWCHNALSTSTTLINWPRGHCSSSDRWKRSKMPERRVVARCNNTANPAIGISMHRIPFLYSENPIAQRRRQKWIDFVLAKRKNWEPEKRLHCARYTSKWEIFSFVWTNKWNDHWIWYILCL